MDPIVMFLLWLLVFVLVVGIGFWLIDKMSIPADTVWIVKTILAAIGLVILVLKTLGRI